MKVGVNSCLPKFWRLICAKLEARYGPVAFNPEINPTGETSDPGCTAYFEARAIAGFISHARVKAPGLQIETRSLSSGFPKQELESGEFDLAIAAYFEDVPAGCKMKTVFSDRFVCVCSKRNPYLKTRQATDDYLSRKHLQIEVPPGVFVPVDQHLKSKGKRREISLRIGNFLTPPAILAKSDFLLTCPSSLAENYREMFSLTITELPFWLPAIVTKMAWHGEDDGDSFHIWLRSRVAQIDD
jgi:DNA-binding transcriptional LysR family regulator